MELASLSDRSVSDRCDVRVAVAPAHSIHNSFINRFSEGISAGGFRVDEFRWDPWLLARADVAILHWPNEFFSSSRGLAATKAAIKLEMLQLARRLCGLRLIWVAHNARPHDTELRSPTFTQRFLDTIDGIIYLSTHSHAAIHSLYHLNGHMRELVTVHGHYCDDQVTEPSVFEPPRHGLRLVYFGQVRPYKNVDELMQCAAQVAARGIELTVAGMQQDQELALRITALARSAQNIRLDLRTEPLPEAELEATIDAGHAVVLPYRQILNSGAALLALSRNRPVLAPRLGSLPELQANVGSDWVYLYDGQLTPAVLEGFAEWMRTRARAARPDLSTYDWNLISRKTCHFIDELRLHD